ncbi:MAG TPA: ABC transporter permease [Candidatus Mediterraneibacter merdipullorum]|nr:ABC transporter permease [Candidatus Mediterraneibacter merdipullorum]
MNKKTALKTTALKATDLRRYALLIVFIAMCIFFTIVSDAFLTAGNLIDVIRSNSISGLLAIGVTYVILSGGIDLSTEAVACLAGIVSGALSSNLPAAILSGLAVGLIFGFINGFILTRTNIQPFIFTLAMSQIGRGIVMIYTKGISIYEIDEKFRELAKGTVGPLPVPIIYFAVIIAVSYVLLNHSRLGRYVYAVGSNAEAARLSGIKVERVRMFVYVLSGLLSALGGILLTARTSAAEVAAADGWSLDAISAVIIGGTSMRGGEGGVFYTILGIFIIAVLNNGLVLLNVPSQYYQFIKGLLMVFAVLVDFNSLKKKS